MFTGIDDTIEFLENLRDIIKYIGISEASNEKGQLRVDVNISMKEIGSNVLGTRAEIKNINSFNSVKEVIEAEIKRQTEVLTSGGIIKQETRRWVDTEKKTVSMRDKVDAIDYKYYVEPNIARVKLTDEFLSDIRKSIPELPISRMNKYILLGINKKDAKTIVRDKSISDYFEKMLELNVNPTMASNWITGKLMGYLKEEKKSIHEIFMSPEMLASLINMVSEGKISSEQAKQVFNYVFEEEKTPSEIVKEKGMEQVSDEGAIRDMVNEVIDENPNQLATYKSGKTNILGFFVGQVLKKSGGKANPSIVNKIVNEEINKR